ncbi:MAG: hypothetical protein AAFP77_20165 [Bacteroidota bacterium]
MKLLKIPDDSGFLGIANFDKYRSFIAKDWDFEIIKTRIVEEINAHHLLFWATGLGNTWKVKIDTQASKAEAFREVRGVIEVTDEKLYLTNYESLTMAAQFEHVKLPEKHLSDLVVELENGKYMVKIRQLFNPDELDFDSDDIHFEIIPMKIEQNLELYQNNVEGIY